MINKTQIIEYTCSCINDLFLQKNTHTLEINGKLFTNICAKACKGYNFKLIEIINGLILVQNKYNSLFRAK